MSWQIEVTDQFERDAKRYAKKRPAEYQAVMENLQKYFEALEVATHPRLVESGFLHEEPRGIRAIDQSGGLLADGKKRSKLEQARLYTYADPESQVLLLICLGSKTTQQNDIRFATDVVVARQRESGSSP